VITGPASPVLPGGAHVHGQGRPQHRLEALLWLICERL
jgi:hypothetical protein